MPEAKMITTKMSKHLESITVKFFLLQHIKKDKAHFIEII